jgi:hypothetical protein
MEFDDSFEERPQVPGTCRRTLDCDGWEGRLRLLLTPAGSRKVDLDREAPFPALYARAA